MPTTAAPWSPAPVAGAASVQLAVVLANMVESALAGGLLATPTPAAGTLGEASGDAARGAEGDRLAPSAHRDRLHPPVDAGAGARAHRVDRPPVRAGRPGGPAGLASQQHRGHRLRFGPVGAQRHPPRRVQTARGP